MVLTNAPPGLLSIIALVSVIENFTQLMGHDNYLFSIPIVPIVAIDDHLPGRVEEVRRASTDDDASLFYWCSRLAGSQWNSAWQAWTNSASEIPNQCVYVCMN